MNTLKLNFWIIVTIIYSAQLYLVSSKNTGNKIKDSGYPLKTYEFQSEDDYMLGMERIPYSKYGDQTIGKPVILLPGMFASSIAYVSHSQSIGFLLSDAGFDVWLLNYRLTGLSKKIKDPRTGTVPKLSSINWNYSFHELAVYDLTAAIDLVLSVTGYKKVDVGGVSLGGSIPLMALAERPEYNEKVRNLILMAPATRMGSAFKGVQHFLFRNIVRQILKINYNMQDRYVSLYRDPDNNDLGQLCKFKIFTPMCIQSMNSIQGFYNPLQEDAVKDIFTSYPQPTSLKTIMHYYQLMISARFCNYDYGPVGNMKHYKSPVAPEYNITRVTAPAIVMYSKKDNLVPPADIQWLLNRLPNVKDTLFIEGIPFSHQSFVMGRESHLVVGPYLIQQLSKDN